MYVRIYKFYVCTLYIYIQSVYIYKVFLLLLLLLLLPIVGFSSLYAKCFPKNGTYKIPLAKSNFSSL